ATVDVSAYGVVHVGGTFDIDSGQASDAATIGTNAQVFALSVSNASIFAGDIASNTGINGSVGSLTVVSITQGTKSWLGVSGSELAVSLVGVSNVQFDVTHGSVKLNRATGAPKLDWTTLATTGLAFTKPAGVTAAIDLHVGGTVALSAFGALTAGGTLSFDQGQVSDAAVGTNAQAMSF